MQMRVYVGLSGGVDSAVSAALLLRQGFAVTGVFIKIWQPEFIECTWERDRIDAMRVAVALGIPFKEIDLSEDYKKSVIDEMTSSYAKGITPNPDVACNERIKFGSFYRWAVDQGADRVATGHYARVVQNGGTHLLCRGVDVQKDQSYFLYRLDRAHLPRIMFPVGGMTKSDVRKLAESLDLPVAKKRDSQGLCFVGDVSMREFLRRYIPVEEGDVVDMSGRLVGRHFGAALYTTGQRHGFTIASAGDASAAHYVTGIDAARNVIRVSADKRDAQRAEFNTDTMHWLADKSMPLTCVAQSRYREDPFKVTVSARAGGCRIVMDEPHIVSAGQSLVLYEEDVCLGGAYIL